MEDEKNKRISKILYHFLGNRFSEKTEEKVQQWLIEDRDCKQKEQASLAFWNTLETEPNAVTYQAFQKVNIKLGISKKKLFTSPHPRLLRIAAVAIPFLMLVGGSYYFFQREPAIKITAIYGERRHIFLPDSSEVWLNSGTTIKYPQKFKNKREISLEGEAYFSVKKDVSKPFVVYTNSISVRVLGTTFNVKAYPNDSKTITTLNSGKVEVETNTKQFHMLNPNEQLIYNNQTSDASVIKVSATDASGWTSGQLIFTNTSFNEILETLERRFNVTFEIPKELTGKEVYTIRFLKNEDLEQILSVLEDVIGDFSYRKDGERIIITAKEI